MNNIRHWEVEDAKIDENVVTRDLKANSRYRVSTHAVAWLCFNCSSGYPLSSH